MNIDIWHDVTGPILPESGQMIFVKIMHQDVLPAIYDVCDHCKEGKFILGFRLPHVSNKGHTIEFWQPQKDRKHDKESIYFAE